VRRTYRPLCWVVDTAYEDQHYLLPGLKLLAPRRARDQRDHGELPTHGH
jgi:hypothetical protein